MATPAECADYGRFAVEIGTPDFGKNGHDEDGFLTDATDTIANVLHAVYLMVGQEGVYRVLQRATDHWQTETKEG